MDEYSEVIPQGEFVVNAIQRAMAQATPLTDATVAGAESYMNTPADNANLLTGIAYWGPTGGACIDASKLCTIPRANVAPYQSSGNVGTYVPSVRIGDLLYSTNPGEAFPEVNAAIANSVTDARSANAVGMAGDMLGYYYQRGDYTTQQFGSSDFARFNVGPNLAQDNANLATANATALGFATTPTATCSRPTTPPSRTSRECSSIPIRSSQSDPTISFYGSSTKSQNGAVNVVGDIAWDFGDGTTDTTASKERFDHTFPGPGTYDVTATVTGSNAATRSWSQRIVIDAPLSATAELMSLSSEKASLSVTGNGGQGTLVSAHWTCQDGSKVSGFVVDCPGTEGGSASVTVADGAGNTATTTVPIEKADGSRRARFPSRSRGHGSRPEVTGPPEVTDPEVGAPRLEIAMLSAPKKVKAGGSAMVHVSVANTGTAVASGATVCLAVKGGKAWVRPGCTELGDLEPGASESITAKLKLKKKAKGKLKIDATAHVERCRRVNGVRDDEGEGEGLGRSRGPPAGALGSVEDRAAPAPR